MDSEPPTKPIRRAAAHLEREAEVLAVGEHGLLGGLVSAAEHGAAAAAGGDEGRGLGAGGGAGVWAAHGWLRSGDGG
jgi:hypothetical protein